MGKLDKLKEKFKNPDSTVTYLEATQLLKGLNFIEDNKGKTSGSRVCFFVSRMVRLLCYINRIRTKN